ncbi:uncharacterized protein V6R79_008907 [Siganus canaliculatus]
MPRYCSVKTCRNRGGNACRQDNERISFYPFPLQDKPRLQEWVNNMNREDWTPSRHQYLCNEHFTDDCFDIRWGIRYLKNTAIPNIFPSTGEDGKKTITIKRSNRSLNEAAGFHCSLKSPLVLGKTGEKVQSSSTNVVAEERDMISEQPSVWDMGISCHSNFSDSEWSITSETGLPEASHFALSQCSERLSEEQTDLAVTTSCCETSEVSCAGETNMEETVVPAQPGQPFNFVPVEMIEDEHTSGFLREPLEGEVSLVCEHSYCRPDTDKDQLWSKILSLHAKILELDRREEKTVTKMHALETEISLLKRDGAVFQEKQKVLEDYIISMLL